MYESIQCKITRNLQMVSVAYGDMSLYAMSTKTCL